MGDRPLPKPEGPKVAELCFKKFKTVDAFRAARDKIIKKHGPVMWVADREQKLYAYKKEK